MRAGSLVLALLAVPLNVELLTALETEPRTLTDLRRATGSPPATTLRIRLRDLAEHGIVDATRAQEVPPTFAYQLGTAGRQLMPVLNLLHRWLAEAPGTPLEPGSPAAKSVIKALADGWSSTIVHALATRPLSLTELDGMIGSLSYPSLERRLRAMHLAGQVEPCPHRGRATPYAACPHLRRAVPLLASAAAWERGRVEVGSPVRPLDVEAALRLALPLLRPSPELRGTARALVDLVVRDKRSLGGALVAVANGHVTVGGVQLDGTVDAEIRGSLEAWMHLATRREPGPGLKFEGDRRFALGLLGKAFAPGRSSVRA